jgi:MFS family permease
VRKNLAAFALRRAAAYISSFPRPVWLLVLATVVESSGRFMVVPYLSLYMSGKGVSLGALGLVLGAAPLASVLFGSLGGHVADTLGRKPVQILGVCLSGTALIGFAFAGGDVVLLACLNFLNGMTRTFYRPATSAALSDFSARERRSEAFALQRIAINAAFGWGPLLGVAIFAASPKAGFIAAGAANLLVGLFIALALPESSPGRSAARGGKAAGSPQAAGWREVLADGGFWLWTLGMAVIWGAYDLIQSFLPLHLKAGSVPLWVYGSLLTANALVCVFVQLPASRIFRKAPIGPLAFASKFLYAAGFIAFAFLRSPWVLVLGMLVLSIGEVVGSAVQVRFIPERAPERLLGRYLGISTLTELGRAVVAPAAGLAMEAWGGSIVFVGAAFLACGGGFLMYLAARMPLVAVSAKEV